MSAKLELLNKCPIPKDGESECGLRCIFCGTTVVAYLQRCWVCAVASHDISPNCSRGCPWTVLCSSLINLVCQPQHSRHRGPWHILCHLSRRIHCAVTVTTHLTGRTVLCEQPMGLDITRPDIGHFCSCCGNNVRLLCRLPSV